jgi:hypothetical protein
VCIDGRSSSEPGTSFRWDHWANTTVKAWIPAPRFDFFEGCHDGYQRLPSPALHGRCVLALAGRHWVVVDTVRAAAAHHLSIGLHVAPGVRVALRGTSSAVLEHASGVSLGIVASDAHGVLSLSPGWVSPAYGARIATFDLTYEVDAEGDAAVLTLLTPLAPGEPPPRVVRRPVEAAAVWAVEFRDGGMELIVENEARRQVVVDGMTCDVRFLWLRRGTDGRPAELVAIGDGALSVDGQDVVCGGPAGWTAGTWQDGHFARES